jgi:NodT family efflux transporter outer membrane factor (OMF) lipoprotein
LPGARGDQPPDLVRPEVIEMRSAAVILIAAIALAGCASGPRPRPDLRLPAAYEAPQPAAAAATAQAPLDRWWTVFGDAQLDALVEQALSANPDAKSAAARLREAQATRTSELSRFLPQGDANASATRTDTHQLSGSAPSIPGLVIPGFQFSGVQDAYLANFDVSWEVDLFGRLIAARRVTDAEVAAAAFDLAEVRAALAAQVADAYFQARGLAIQLDDARETVRIDRDLYELAAKRAELGLAASSEADRVAGDLARAEAQAEALAAELQVEKRTLLILAGRTFEATIGLDTPPDVGRPPAIPASLPGDLLRRRPDVRQAEAEVAAAVGRENLARLAFLPTVTLKPGVGWSKTIESGAELGLGNWSIGGAIAQPILDIPNLLAQLHVQNARTAQAVAGYEKTLRTAFGEAEGALVRLDADRRRVALLTDGEERARRAYEASRLGYDRGLVDLQTTLSAETSWRATRAELTSAQVASLRQAVQAFKAIGGGWPGAAAGATAAAAAPAPAG